MPISTASTSEGRQLQALTVRFKNLVPISISSRVCSSRVRFSGIWCRLRNPSSARLTVHSGEWGAQALLQKSGQGVVS